MYKLLFQLIVMCCSFFIFYFNIQKEYQWSVGDKVYVGANQYIILEDGDEITLQDENFPLLLEYYSKNDFLNLLKENIVCPKLLTTGTPLTYSTASDDIVSKAF